MNLFSADYQCAKCGVRFNALVDRAARPQLVPCDGTEGCDGIAAYVIGAPMVMQASYPDGTSRGDGYNKLKEAAALRVQAADMPRDKRGEIEREISKLESIKPAEGGK